MKLTLSYLTAAGMPRPAADEFQNVQTQLQAIPGLANTVQLTVGAAGSASALPATPSLYLLVEMPATGTYKGQRFVCPLYAVE